MGAHSPRQSLALALVTGAVSTIPVWRASRGVRAAVIVGTGVTTAVGVAVVMRRPDLIGEDREPMENQVSVVAGVGAGGAMAAATAVAFTLDRVFEQSLVRRGVPHPRLVIGAAGAVLSYALDVLDRPSD